MMPDEFIDKSDYSVLFPSSLSIIINLYMFLLIWHLVFDVTEYLRCGADRSIE